MALSIRYKLYLAFGAVSLLAIVSAVVALIQLNNIGQKQSSIINKSIPTVIQSQELKITSLRFINKVTVLSSINDAEEFKSHVNLIAIDRESLSQLINNFDYKNSENNTLERIEFLVEEMIGLIEGQSKLVSQRIKLIGQRQKLMLEVQASANSIESNLEPNSNPMQLGLARLQIDNLGIELGDSLDSYLEAVDGNFPKDEQMKRLDKFVDYFYESLEKISTFNIKNISTYLDVRLAVSQVVGALRADSTLTLDDDIGSPQKELASVADRLNETLTTIENEELRSPVERGLKGLIVIGLNTAKVSLNLKESEFKLYKADRLTVNQIRSRELELANEISLLFSATEKISVDLDETINELLLQAKNSIVSSSRQVNKAISISKIVVISIAIFIAFSAFFIAWFYVGNIIRRLLSISNSMNAISKGNLDSVIPEQGKDEVGDMSKALSIFKDNALSFRALSDDFEENVKQATDTVSKETFNVYTAVKTMSLEINEASNDSASVSEISKKTTASIKHVAKETERLSFSIDSIKNQADNSKLLCGHAVKNTHDTIQTMRDLSNTAQRISEVIGLIDQIASQTNLLALNATIEAARAGEAGRGFAVVAAEVKTLAQQTSKATEEIIDNVKSVQSVSEKAVNETNLIGQAVSEINENINVIAGSIIQQHSATKKISDSVNEISCSTNQVSLRVSSVSSIMKKTSDSSNSSLQNCSVMKDEIKKLSLQVDSFLDRVK